MADNNPAVSLQSWGPTHSELQKAARGLLQQEHLAANLKDAQHRLISVTTLDSDTKTERPVEPTRYRAVFYDYTNNRTLVANADLRAGAARAEITEHGSHELPSAEEFEAAVRILEQHAELGPSVRDGKLRPYRPMPPLVHVERPDGRVERIIAVGLNSPASPRNRIVGVNLNHAGVLPHVDGLPSASDLNCGPPAEGNCPATTGAQRATVQIKVGNTVLWDFVLVRPSASSGTNGSAIELQHVRYKGKQVLYRAHIPILNIQYLDTGGFCGPTYRDWENEENCFEAVGSDPVPGFRLCTSPATTIFDTGSDAGNFRGVAIYVAGQEVVVVSEMAAGWYRYIPMWRFHVDGTLSPRMAFGAVNNGCTCRKHHHHTYWRLDFDIETASPNLVEEFNDPILVGNSHWHKKTYEIRRPRSAARKRKWKVSNTVTGSAYELIPGGTDGNADTYGVGDLWVLRYKSTEIDDGQGFTTDPVKSIAHLDNFLNPAEPVENQDVVLWYVGHFLHDEAHPSGPHIIGPEIKPVKW